MNRNVARVILLVLVVEPLVAQSPKNAQLVDLVTRMAKIGRAGSPSFSPDGKRIAYVSDQTGVPQVWVTPAEGGTPVQVTKGDDPIGRVIWSPKGEWLALSIAPGGGMNTQIYVVRPDGSGLRRLTDGGKETNNTRYEGIDLATLVRPELVSFAAHDGLGLSGWLYRPIARSGPAPFVVSFHGGPEGQERPGFRSDYQALVAQGIGVFAPNVRGSSGFGKRFVNLDNGPLRFEGIKDLKDCVDYLVTNRIADPKRVGITGGSYGGYMTMVGVTFYPDLFAAGVDLFGMVNFFTFFEKTEPWMAAISTTEYGDPKTQENLLRDLSPLGKLDRIKTPLMVQHGANDTNVPVVEAEQIVENLKRRGVPVEYILFPDEGHGFRKEKNRITSTVKMVEFFVAHLNQ